MVRPSKAQAHVKRSRGPLSPKPILDRKLLTKALSEKGIELKPGRLDAFYQLLHRQHYPPIGEFIRMYQEGEKLRLSGRANQIEKGARASAGEDIFTASSTKVRVAPLKNNVSARGTKKNLHLLPRQFLDFLADSNCGFVALTSKVVDSRLSKDGSTTKLAVELQDGHFVESVIMRHRSPNGSRATLCVSSQVGCAMGCTFCATGTMGIRGNLTSGEILEQIVHANHILADEANEAILAAPTEGDNSDESDGSKENISERDVAVRTKKGKKKKKKEENFDMVRNVVFMGMGEPLNNYDNVIEACKGLIDSRRWNLSHGRVTVSTVGVTPKILKLTQDLPQVSLALSLHAPNQEARARIVPAAKAYPITALIDAVDGHMMAFTKRKDGDDTDVGGYSEKERKLASKKNRAMIEYVMIEGESSTFKCAHQLGKLCENRHLIVNLIPYNQTDVEDKIRCPPTDHILEFQRIIMSYGNYCYVRKTMGADIAGACGQLIVEKEKKTNAASAGDIEDGPFTAGTRKDSKPAPLVKDKVKRKARSAVSAPKSMADSPLNKSDAAVSVNFDGEVGGDGDAWIRPLAIATGMAASCFLLSTTLLLKKRRQ